MHLVAEEAAGNVDLLAPDDNNLLAVEDLLRDNRSKAAQKMALAVNDNGGGGECGHGASGCGVGKSRQRVGEYVKVAESGCETNLEMAREIDRVQRCQREADVNT